MLPAKSFSLAEVLAISPVHPFYNRDVQYPPDEETIRVKRDEVAQQNVQAQLKSQPLLWKKDLYTVIERLVDDTSPQNTFRQSVYTSTTGGGSGSKTLFFATDVLENRLHRAMFGRLLRSLGVIAKTDWVVTIHSGGELYRSLDLTLELLENAGATVLAAGHSMSPAGVCKLIAEYHANALSGDSSQIVSLVHFISTLPQAEREKLKLDKVIYTSESLTAAQRLYIRDVLGQKTKIHSLLGSAEGGPYGASHPELTQGSHDDGEDYASRGYEDFIIDDRITMIEILPSTLAAEDANQTPATVPDGEVGVVAQTCLTRLRNPVVRYVTGDVGSVHRLSDAALATVPESDREHMYVFRLYGRDRRLSFEWGGEYVEFSNLNKLMCDAALGILQWQVLLGKSKELEEALLEVRLLLAYRSVNGSLVAKEALLERITYFFAVCDANRTRFRLVIVDSVNEFELSAGGRKVIKFIDRFND